MHFFCFMISGKPLTEQIREVLFDNAHEMIQAGDEHQLIQYGDKYDGIIKTDLEVINFCGAQIVHFEAELVYQPYGYTKVKYAIRINDLEKIHEAGWDQIAIRRK